MIRDFAAVYDTVGDCLFVFYIIAVQKHIFFLIFKAAGFIIRAKLLTPKKKKINNEKNPVIHRVKQGRVSLRLEHTKVIGLGYHWDTVLYHEMFSFIFRKFSLFLC